MATKIEKVEGPPPVEELPMIGHEVIENTGEAPVTPSDAWGGPLQPTNPAPQGGGESGGGSGDNRPQGGVYGKAWLDECKNKYPDKPRYVYYCCTRKHTDCRNENKKDEGGKKVCDNARDYCKSQSGWSPPSSSTSSSIPDLRAR